MDTFQSTVVDLGDAFAKFHYYLHIKEWDEKHYLYCLWDLFYNCFELCADAIVMNFFIIPLCLVSQRVFQIVEDIISNVENEINNIDNLLGIYDFYVWPLVLVVGFFLVVFWFFWFGLFCSFLFGLYEVY